MPNHHEEIGSFESQFLLAKRPLELGQAVEMQNLAKDDQPKNPVHSSQIPAFAPKGRTRNIILSALFLFLTLISLGRFASLGVFGPQGGEGAFGKMLRGLSEVAHFFYFDNLGLAGIAVLGACSVWFFLTTFHRLVSLKSFQETLPWQQLEVKVGISQPRIFTKSFPMLSFHQTHPDDQLGLLFCTVQWLLNPAAWFSSLLEWMRLESLAGIHVLPIPGNTKIKFILSGLFSLVLLPLKGLEKLINTPTHALYWMMGFIKKIITPPKILLIKDHSVKAAETKEVEPIIQGNPMDQVQLTYRLRCEELSDGNTQEDKEEKEQPVPRRITQEELLTGKYPFETIFDKKRNLTQLRIQMNGKTCIYEEEPVIVLNNGRIMTLDALKRRGLEVDPERENAWWEANVKQRMEVRKQMMLAEFDRELEALRASREAEIAQLRAQREAETAQRATEMAQLKEEVAQCATEIAQLRAQREAETAQLKEKIAEETALGEAETAQRATEIAQLRAQREAETAQLKEKIAEETALGEAETAQLSVQRKAENAQLATEIAQLATESAHLKEKIAEETASREAETTQLKEQFAQQEARLAQQEVESTQLKEQLAQQEAQIAEIYALLAQQQEFSPEIKQFLENHALSNPKTLAPITPGTASPPTAPPPSISFLSVMTTPAVSQPLGDANNAVAPNPLQREDT